VREGIEGEEGKGREGRIGEGICQTNVKTASYAPVM